MQPQKWKRWSGLVLLMWTLATRAATYYVAAEDPRAADTNLGTEAQPWKTINRSLPALRPGDTVLIKKGVYREAVALRSKPQEGQPVFPSGTGYDAMITFAAYPPDRGQVVLKGSDVVMGWTKFRDHIWMQTNWPTYTQQVFCDGQLLDQIGGVLLPAPEALKPRGSNVNDMAAGTFFCDETNRAL